MPTSHYSFDEMIRNLIDESHGHNYDDPVNDLRKGSANKQEMLRELFEHPEKMTAHALIFLLRRMFNGEQDQWSRRIRKRQINRARTLHLGTRHEPPRFKDAPVGTKLYYVELAEAAVYEYVLIGHNHAGYAIVINSVTPEDHEEWLPEPKLEDPYMYRTLSVAVGHALEVELAYHAPRLDHYQQVAAELEAGMPSDARLMEIACSDDTEPLPEPS